MTSPLRMLLLALLALSVFLPDRARAWGWNGHRAITEAAVAALPTPLRTYFEANLTLIKNQAATEPPGRHYIDIDYYPEFFAGTFPRDFGDLVAIYGSSVVEQNGRGPWVASWYYDDLVDEFAAATGSADWINLMYTAGPLAHYIEDLHNPMHLTLNYNGQLTGQYGLHSRYESILVNAKLAEGVLQPHAAPEDCVYHPSILDAIFDDIDRVYPHNPAILAADLSAYAQAGDRESALYYERLWADGCDDLTPVVMNQAVAMVASAWYSAWRDAGFPQPYGVAPSADIQVRMVAVSETGSVIAVTGDAGQDLTMQTSSNLVSWANAFAFTNLDGRTRIEVPGASHHVARFYRACFNPGE